MILNLPNVSLLGLTQNYKTFGAGFNYSNSKELSVNGLLTNFSAVSGVSGIWNSLSGVRINQNFSSIILNNYDFGSGRINSISFDNGQDVQTKGYTIGLEVFETGNLFNLTGNYYSGINTSSFQYLQDFSEFYKFNKKLNGGYSYDHNASIRFNSGVGNLNAITAAKTLAKSLFTGSSLGLLFYSGYTSKIGKRFYTESYDLISNACNFVETFDFDADLGDYSLLRTNEFQLGENGIVNVTENGNIKGITFPTHISAVAALDTSMSGAYDRCTGVFAIYYTGAADPLINSPFAQSRTFDIFNNNLGYSLTFSNDRSNSGLYFWNYTQQTDYSDGIAKITENGTIVGRGSNRTQSFLNAQNGLSYVKSGIFNRTLTNYRNQSLYTGIFIEQKSEGFSPFQGVVDYNYVFTNEKVYPATGGVKWVKVSESNTNPIYLYTKFGIFNQGEIIQDQKNETLGNKSVRMDMKGEKGVTLDIYLENAKTIANTMIPSGSNTYIIDSNYNYDENNNSLELTVGWSYNKGAVKTIAL